MDPSSPSVADEAPEEADEAPEEALVLSPLRPTQGEDARGVFQLKRQQSVAEIEILLEQDVPIEKIHKKLSVKYNWSALDLGDLIKTTVQKAMIQKNGKGFLQLVYRNGRMPRNDLLQLINDKIMDSGQALGTYQQIEITDEELGPHLTKDELQIADARGQSALHLAVQYCCKHVIIKMLNSGADPLKKDIDGLTSGHYAAIAGNFETFGELPLETYTSRDFVAKRMPIHYAAICGKMEILDLLITIAKQNIDTEDGFGSTPLVLAAMYGHPTVAEELIERGASGDVVNRNNIPAITVVNQHYDSLGEIMLDRWKKFDEYENSITVNLEPSVARDTVEGSNDKYSFYQILVSTSKTNGTTSHPVIRELTDKKWDLYAQKRFILILISLAFFNLFWTSIYIWPHTHGSNVNLKIIGIIVMFFGGFSILFHVMVNAYVVMKKRMFNNYLNKTINQAYEFEKSAKHPLTETHFKHVKNEYKKALKKRSFASTLLVFMWKCAIDSMWLTFLGMRVHAFLEGDKHHDEEGEEADADQDLPMTGGQMYLRISDIVISILLIMVWIQLFAACSISKTVGRFVVFTREVVKDVGQVFSVYVVLFIPMTAIFWKTIYTHTDTKKYHVTWYDVPFVVLRMLVVDYNYEMGKSSAERVNLGPWWDIISIMWLLLSAMIMLNLFIALMTDRYTRLGDGALALCSHQRAQFVAACELLMGRKSVSKFSKKMIQDEPMVTFPLEEHDHQESMLSELRSLSEKMEDLTKKFDQIAGIGRVKTPGPLGPKVSSPFGFFSGSGSPSNPTNNSTYNQNNNNNNYHHPMNNTTVQSNHNQEDHQSDNQMPARFRDILNRQTTPKL